MLAARSPLGERNNLSSPLAEKKTPPRFVSGAENSKTPKSAGFSVFSESKTPNGSNVSPLTPRRSVAQLRELNRLLAKRLQEEKSREAEITDNIRSSPGRQAEMTKLQSELDSTRHDISELQAVIQRLQKELDSKQETEAAARLLEAKIQQANAEMTTAAASPAPTEAARRTLDKVRRLRAELERQRAGSQESDRRLAELEGHVDRISISKGLVQARVSEFEMLRGSLEQEKERAEARARMLRQESELIRKSGEEKSAKFRGIVDNLTRERDSLLAEKKSAETKVTHLEVEVAEIKKNSNSKDVHRLERDLKDAEMAAEERTRQLSKMEGVVDRLRREIEARESSNRTQLVKLGQSLQEAEYATARAEALTKALARSMTQIAELEAKLSMVRDDLASVAAERDGLRSGIESATSAAEDTLARERSLSERFASLESDKAALERQLLEVHDALQAMQSRVEQLSDKHKADLGRVLSRVKEYEARSQDLESSLRSKDAELNAAQSAATEKVAVLEVRVASLQENLSGLLAERTEAHSRLIELEAAYRDALERASSVEQDLEVARVQGTPKGEAAKQVVPLALQRVRELQGRLEAAHGETAAAAARTASFEQQLMAAQADAQARASELSKAQSDLTETLASLQSARVESERLFAENAVLSVAERAAAARSADLLKERARQARRLDRLRQELQAMSESLRAAQEQGAEAAAGIARLSEERDALTAAVGQAEASLASVQEELARATAGIAEAAVREAAAVAERDAIDEECDSLRRTVKSLEASRTAAKDRSARLDTELAAARSSVAALTSRVTELVAAVDAARMQGTPKGEAAKQVVPLALGRVRALQVDLQEAKEQSNEAEQRAKTLDVQLESVQAELERSRRESEQLRAQLSASAAANAALVCDADGLRGEVVSMSLSNAALEGSMHEVSTRVAFVEARMAVLTAERDNHASRAADIEARLRAITELSTDERRRHDDEEADLRFQLQEARAGAFSLSVQLEGARDQLARAKWRSAKLDVRVASLTQELESTQGQLYVLGQAHEALESYRNSLEAEMEGMVARGAAGDAERAALQARLSQATADLARSTESLEEARSHMAQLEGKLKAVEARGGQTEAHIFRLEGKLSAAKAKLEKTEASWSALSTRHQALSQEADGLRSELSRAAARADCDAATVAELQSLVTAADARVSSLEGDLSQARSDLAASLAEASELARQLSVSQAAVAQTASANEALSAEVEAAKARGASFEALASDLKGKLSEVEAGHLEAASAAAVRLAAVVDDLAQARTSLAFATFKAHKLETRLGSSESSLAEARAQVGFLGECLSSMESQRDALMVEVSDIRAALSNSQAETEGQRDAVSDLEGRLEASEAHAFALSAEIASVRDQLAAAKFRAAKMQGRVASGQARIDMLESLAQSLTNEKESAELEVESLRSWLIEAEANASSEREEGRARVEMLRAEAAAVAARASLLEVDLSSVRDSLAAALFAKTRSQTQATRTQQELAESQARADSLSVIVSELESAKKGLEEDAEGLRAAVATLEREASEGREDMRLKRKDIKRLQRQLLAVEKKNEALDASLAVRSEEVTAARAQIDELSARLSRSDESNAALSASLSAIATEAGCHKARAEFLTVQVACLQGARREMEERAAEERTAFASLLGEAAARVGAISRDLDAARTELAAVTAKADDLSDALELEMAARIRLEADVASGTALSADLAALVSCLATSKSALEDQMKVQKAQIISLEAAGESQRAEAQRLRVESAERAVELAKVSRTLGSVAARLTLTEQRAEELAAANVSLSMANEILEAQSAGRAARVAHLESVAATLSAERDALTSDAAASRVRIADLENQLAAAQDGWSSAEARADALEQSRDQVSLRADQLQRDLEVARVQGTPKGDAAKAILPMALQRVRDLQGQVESAKFETEASEVRAAQLSARLDDARREVAEAEGRENALKAQLQVERATLVDVRAKCDALAAQNSALSESQKASAAHTAQLLKERNKKSRRLVCLRSDLESVEARLAEAESAGRAGSDAAALLSSERDALRQQLAMAEARVSELEVTVEATLRNLEVSVAREAEQRALRETCEDAIADLSSEIVRHQNDRSAAALSAAALEAQVMAARAAAAAGESRISELEAELSAARLQGTPRGEAAKKVVPMALQRVRDLQSEILAQQALASNAEGRAMAVSEELSEIRRRLESALLEAASSNSTLQERVANLEEVSLALAEAKAAALGKASEEAQARAAAEEAARGAESKAAGEAAARMAAEERAAVASEEARRLDSEKAAAEDAAASLRLEVQSLMDRFQLLESHRDASDKEASKQRSRTFELERQLGEAMEALSRSEEESEALRAAADEARVQGTPKGEGAKVVSKMAMDRVRELQSALRDQHERMEQLDRQVMDAQAEVTSVRKQLSDAQAMIRGLNRANARLEGEKRKLEADAKEREYVIDSLRQEKSNLSHELDAVRDDKENAGRVAACLRSQLDDVSTERTTLKDRVTSLNVRLVAAKLQRNAARKMRDAAGARNQELEVEGSALKGRVAQLSAEIESLRITGEEKEALLRKAETELGAVRASFDVERSGLLAQLEVAKITGTPRGDAAKRVSRLALERVRALQMDLEASSSRVRELESLLEEARAEAASERAAAASLLSEKEALEDEAAILRAAVSDARAEGQGLQERLDQALERLGSFRRQVEELEEENDSVRCMLETNERFAREIGSQLEQSRKRADELRRALTAREEEVARARGLSCDLMGRVKESEATAGTLIAEKAALERELGLAARQVAELEARLSRGGKGAGFWSCFRQQVA